MWNLINNESNSLLLLCKKKSLKISTAESCTGGLISSSIVHNNGSSEIFEDGFITYSNQSKIVQLNVEYEDIKTFGAVSSTIAKQMLIGLLKKTQANIGIAITGIAGPSGGSFQKPVGTVWICYGSLNVNICKKFNFKGDRLNIRMLSTLNSLIEINKFIKKNYP